MNIFVKVKTGAKEEKVEKIGENNYAVFVKERPEKGLANKAVIKILSRYFKVPQKNAIIISGSASRQKMVKIYGKIKLGKYQHFKGGVYEVIGSAKHSETLEEIVVYKNEKGNMWVRPKNMFFENVLIDGRKIPRFKYLGD